jgi:hypothetical protein
MIIKICHLIYQTFSCYPSSFIEKIEKFKVQILLCYNFNHSVIFVNLFAVFLASTKNEMHI